MARKYKKVVGEGGAHGGSWKVAYADFMTAMMAFFLLMWLINMAPPETKEELAGYFREFSMFDTKGGSWMQDKQGSNAGVTMQQSPDAPPGEQEPVQTQSAPLDQQEMQENLKEDIKSELQGMEDQVIVENIAGGTRIQIVDKQGNPIFAVGSATMNANGQKILRVVSESLKAQGQKIAVEGHTDALSYSTSRMSNWELSTDRASEARRQLQVNGLNPDCILRVSGFAATQPYIKENPYDPRNRRLSILIFSNTSCAAPGARSPNQAAAPDGIRRLPNPLSGSQPALRITPAPEPSRRP
jgi:chemotaxis protein MotB